MNPSSIDLVSALTWPAASRCSLGVLVVVAPLRQAISLSKIRARDKRWRWSSTSKSVVHSITLFYAEHVSSRPEKALLGVGSSSVVAEQRQVAGGESSPAYQAGSLLCNIQAIKNLARSSGGARIFSQVVFTTASVLPPLPPERMRLQF